MSNPPAGQHQLTIWWFLNGQQVATVAEGVSGKSVTGSANVYFTAVYTSGGRGTARLYWDMPTNTDLSPDAFLARDRRLRRAGPGRRADRDATLPDSTPTPGPTVVATPTAPPTTDADAEGSRTSVKLL